MGKARAPQTTNAKGEIVIKDSYRQLGLPKTLLLGLQHMFAMFGATILIPLIGGLSVQVTLIGVGVGTLIFHIISKGRVPVFLGSSFAFLVGIQLVTNPEQGVFAGTGMTHAEKLPYATGAIMVAGLLYVVLAIIVKVVGVKTVMRYLPPVVTGPIVMLIGFMLAPFAIDMSSNNLLLAITALCIVVIAAVWGKGMVKVVPMILGLLGGYALALILHFVFGASNPDGSAIFEFSQIAQANIVGAPPFAFARFNLSAILIMAPFALATIAEHIADMVILSDVCEEDFMKDPGLVRTLIGDGLATCFSGLIGGPASTTYSENVCL
ncbi:MAG: uracil-xanthine permease, partial [Oscillospiraceae bacterium]|nr:uracil-xanthine permease [Oscillospiraceae bacterium]